MCSSSSNTEKSSCCTPLCLKRKKDAAVRSWYYAPSGTSTIPDIDADLSLLNYTVTNNFQYIDSDYSPLPQQQQYPTAIATNYSRNYRPTTQLNRRVDLDVAVEIGTASVKTDENVLQLCNATNSIDAKVVSPSADTAATSIAPVITSHRSSTVAAPDNNCSRSEAAAKAAKIVSNSVNVKSKKEKKQKSSGQKLRLSKQLCKHRQGIVYFKAI